MKLIVGLGNPGERYERTRHNVGFRAVERFAADHGIRIDGKKWNGLYGQGDVAGERVALVLPQTYMNLSGESAGPAMRFFKVELADVVAVHDELDLPLGRLQLKLGGGSAGHNGLKSLTQHLGADFYRMRIGVSRPPPDRETVDYVLQDFSRDEEKMLTDVLARAAEGLKMWIEKGPAAAMNSVNRKT